MVPKFELPAWMVETDTGVAITIELMSRGSRNRVCGLSGGNLLVSLNVASTDVGANSILVKFLAQELDISSAQISVVAGGSGKSKRILIEAVRPPLVSMRLSPK